MATEDKYETTNQVPPIPMPENQVQYDINVPALDDASNQMLHELYVSMQPVTDTTNKNEIDKSCEIR
ncbi:unnamed protein product [Didymodactylos carnosus]|uniref:Uncharacterized protein n=1 Tax=Didymodactylos carnosus TaxID=1234261 RepID=A0A813R8W2_9BILA|nr:unnamed protein product [Didymodactylos carnosus]CAF1314604.1 unnamed protein product [Didymodactylos carnosus]CAF3561395.1 unnamed protein product [Didymodactylos carnosus]CAF4123335.1 unnamed protein product [Didymodactylos carnosus]